MKILIYGSKEFGRVVKSYVNESGNEFAGFIDDFNEGPEIVGTYKSARKTFPKEEYEIVNAVGYKNLDARDGVTQKILSDGYRLAHIIHRTAYVADSATLGKGCIIMAKAVVDVHARIRDAVVLWPGAVVSHDSTIGKNSFLAPNCTVCGYARVGENCFVGAGAVVVDHVVVPDKSFVKASSVWV